MQQVSGADKASSQAPPYRGSACGVMAVRSRDRYRKRTLIAALIGAAAAAAVFFLSPRDYTAQTLVILTELRNGAAVGDDPASAAAIIASRDFIQEAISRTEYRAEHDIDPISMLRELICEIRPVFPSLLPATCSDRKRDENAIIQSFRNRLNAQPAGEARLLKIGFTASTSESASRITDALAAIYLEWRRKAVADHDAELRLSLQAITEARTQLQAALTASEAFQADNRSLKTAQSARSAREDIGLLIAGLQTLQQQQVMIERRLQTIGILQETRDLFQIPEEGAALLRHLVQQRLTTHADLMAETRIRAPRHWRVRALSARMADLDEQIGHASNSALSGLSGELQGLKRQIKEQESAIALRRALIAADNDNQQQQAALDQRIMQAQIGLELANSAHHEAVEKIRLNSSGARIVSHADAPRHADPTLRAGPSVLVGAGLFLAIWIIGALIPRRKISTDTERELHSMLVDEPDNIQPASSHAPVRPVTPTAVGEKPLVSVKVEQEQFHQESSGQLFDGLLARLAIVGRNDRGRRILVTEANALGDASLTALLLARHLSQKARTILIDLTGTQRGHEEGQPRPGFMELIAGQASFAEIIDRDAGSRLHCVNAGRGDMATIPALGDTVELALAALEQTYEWVVYAVSDAHRGSLGLFLGKRADGIVLSAAEDAVEIETFAVYEDLREKGISNIAIALTGSPVSSS